MYTKPQSNLGLQILSPAACTKKISVSTAEPTFLQLPSTALKTMEKELEVWPEDGYGNSQVCCFPRVACPTSEKGEKGWGVADRTIIKQSQRDEWNGVNYVMRAEGIFGITGAGKLAKLANFQIKPRFRILRYVHRNEAPKVFFELQIRKFNAAIKTLTVQKSDFKHLIQVLKKEFPDLFISVKFPDALAEYITDVADEAMSEKIEETIEVDFNGWFYNGGKLCYFYGKKDISKSPIEKRSRAFLNGFDFLNVGRQGTEIAVLWLYAHFSYVAYFFEAAQCEIHSVLFLKGLTGSLKTSVAKELSNVFELNPKKKMISFGSTEASVMEWLEKLSDQLFLLDDFSNSEKAKATADQRLFERVIRIIGDGVAPTKMESDKRILQRFIRLAVIITGEDDPDLSLSSMNRTITVNVNKQTFCGDDLRRFQENPEIMREYFTAFVSFLQENGKELEELIKEKVPEYRKKYRRIFDAARFVDAIVNLRIVSDIIGQFTQYCQIADQSIYNRIAVFEHDILAVLQENQRERKVLSVPVMYLMALMQSIGAKKGQALAASEEIYVENMTNHMGFEEKFSNTIWLDHKKAYAMVCEYWRALKQDFRASSKNVHAQLCEQMIAIRQSKGSGFLQKAKKGDRKPMLVLDKNAVEKILDEERML